ncbi:MAG: hypothetical protein JSR46_07660 [Verrucomicrobia bacterium]|nr:hypothetical protein [Verrucomicrobiota bacterium]
MEPITDSPRDLERLYGTDTDWSPIETAIQSQEYEKAWKLLPLEEALGASDARIGALIELVLKQPFSDPAKQMVFNLLSTRSYHLSPSMTTRIAALAGSTMRAHLLLWKCSTYPYDEYKPAAFVHRQAKSVVESVFNGILCERCDEIDRAVFAQADHKTLKNFQTFTIPLQEWIEKRYSKLKSGLENHKIEMDDGTLRYNSEDELETWETTEDDGTRKLEIRDLDLALKIKAHCGQLAKLNRIVSTCLGYCAA